MLHIIKLLLPAVIPSWRFFDVIAPSPRIQFTLLNSKNGPSSGAQVWREFRPPPARVSFLQMLGHMFWNPRRNESLFLVSCAERILQQYTEHSEDEILKRIAHELVAHDAHYSTLSPGYLQFRLLLVQRKGTRLQQKVVFHSRIQALPMQDIP
ncbi:MAG TPA: hypothetical protein ENK04_02625 [Gammaproteobacteria bacterium]|nr:hypothetical protein [Gammaproteobacteria bacterium]